MVMKDKWITYGVSSFDEGLVVDQLLKASQCYSVFWQGFKKAKVVSCRITERHQEKDSSVSEYDFQDFANLQQVRTDHFGNHYEARAVGSSKDHHLMVELVSIFQNVIRLDNITGCDRGHFSRKKVLRRTEEAAEASEKL